MNIENNLVSQQKAMITQAIAELSSRTCLQFRPATNADSYSLLFQNDPMNGGCWSHVGWQNVKNQVCFTLLITNNV
jgi:hypothetical protein